MQTAFSNADNKDERLDASFPKVLRVSWPFNRTVLYQRLATSSVASGARVWPLSDVGATLNTYPCRTEPGNCHEELHKYIAQHTKMYIHAQLDDGTSYYKRVTGSGEALS